MLLPCLVRAPYQSQRGAVQDAMITWADLTPTILDVAGVAAGALRFDGRSFRAGLEGGKLTGWDEVFASHSFHGITMYYPMRVVRTRRYKLIVNLASELTFPNANDLIHSPTWISATKLPGQLLGRRPIAQFLHRPRFELYDLDRDPDELDNRADDPALASVKADLTARMKALQLATKDPWLHKWNYE
jgi:N-sulfoglucosamine sulfohydrolase